MKNEDFKSIFKEYYKAKSDINFALKKLREVGASKADCVKIVKVELNIGLRQADEIVLNSETWADTKETTLAFRKNVDKSINELIEICDRTKRI